MDNTRYSAPALEKGLDIIELPASHPEGLSLADLGKTLGHTTAEIFAWSSRWKRVDICWQ
ncbi:MAG: Transcriptional regulator, IclR family [uncultured Caballeronia sp.]|nr:MAG: Transcriptional regulator, IclR family [uncultured Caballeronia sp.]